MHQHVVGWCNSVVLDVDILLLILCLHFLSVVIYPVNPIEEKKLIYFPNWNTNANYYGLLIWLWGCSLRQNPSGGNSSDSGSSISSSRGSKEQCICLQKVNNKSCSNLKYDNKTIYYYGYKIRILTTDFIVGNGNECWKIGKYASARMFLINLTTLLLLVTQFNSVMLIL